MGIRADVVIGANFGDEGKGLLTDYLVRQKDSGEKTTVVRFNGGAQAGHTVQTYQNRFVFGHLGSGTLAGAATHLSSHFLVDPLAFQAEFDRLTKLKDPKPKWPDVSIDPGAIVVTPYDKMINQLLERRRARTSGLPMGEEPHGSCGMGINETVVRTYDHNLTISAFELIHDRPVDVTTRLNAVRSYVDKRLLELGIEPDEKFIQEMEINWMDHWTKAIQFMRNRVTLTYDHQLLKTTHNIVFEGAQGLGLDEVNGEFPHVTRSRTGLTNVLTLAEEIGIQELDVFYATRCYATRHGNGPMDLGHGVYGAFDHIKDDTNQPNIWQGSLRFQPLHLSKTAQRIATDLLQVFNHPKVHVSPRLFVSCTDQFTGGRIPIYHRGDVMMSSPGEVSYFLNEMLHFSNRQSLYSKGPHCSDVYPYAG